MNEYLEKALNLLTLISIDDIKKFLNIDNTNVLDIWGNYDAFFDSQTNPQTELSTYVWICENNIKDFKYDEYKRLGMSIYIIGKIGYIKFCKEYLKFIFNFLYKRNDLNIFTRLYLSIIKASQKIKRNRFQIEINKFTNNQIQSNKYIFKLFKERKINRLYLYKFNSKKLDY